MEIKPSKKLGQNFLINKGVVGKIIEAADLKSEDIVLEIGPGLGVLTEELIKKAKKVIAVEKDTRLANVLKDKFRDSENIEIINNDILKTDMGPAGSYKIVANLPFNIASAIIQKFLETRNRPSEMIVLVQKEVAQRICAKPPEMSILAVSVQILADPKILFYVSKGSFRPMPKVDAALLKLTPRNRLSLFRPDLFFRIVKTGFSHPRKQLLGNLSKGLGKSKEETEEWLRERGIGPFRRAETLSVEEWIKLTK